MYFADEKELEAVRRVFLRKKLFRYQLSGPGECDLFEKEFSEKLGVPYSLLVSSGTNALIAALSASGVGPGDEVIIPAYTFVATATAVVGVGAIPVIANIDETLGISPKEIEAKTTSRTKAIIPVHMDGLAADMAEVTRIARGRGISVIEDAAQAIGGSYRGTRLGALGDFGCFSLNDNKNISSGEGGIVTTLRRDLYEKAFCIQDASAQFNPVHKDTFREIVPFMGSSMRVSEITGAIMRVQLERLDGILADLKARKEVIAEKLSGYRDATIILGNCPKGDCGSSLHLLFPDPDFAGRAGTRLRKEGILFAPVTTRPAHACWKWMQLLGDRASNVVKRNPYSLTDKKYQYHPADYLQSVGILTRTAKMDIDIHASIDESARMGERIYRVLRDV